MCDAACERTCVGCAVAHFENLTVLRLEAVTLTLLR